MLQNDDDDAVVGNVVVGGVSYAGLASHQAVAADLVVMVITFWGLLC